MKLTDKEKEFLADWFYEKEERVDYDGIILNYKIPEYIMKIYRKKHPDTWNYKKGDWKETLKELGSLILIVILIIGFIALLVLIGLLR